MMNSKTLTDIFDLMDEERARRLLDGVQLGDRKPSALLAEIKGLVGGRSMDFLIKEMVFRALPSSVAAICRCPLRIFALKQTLIFIWGGAGV